jgi:hypothetical protein
MYTNIQNRHYEHNYQYTKNQLRNHRKYPKRKSTHTENNNGTKLFAFQIELQTAERAIGAPT